MNPKIQELTSLLQQQFKVYNDLYYLLDEEYSYLTDGKTDEINKVVSAKLKFLDRLDELEFIRVKLSEEVATSLGLNKEAGLREIALQCEEATQKTLLTWKGTFDALLQNLKEKNHANNLLARSALNTVESTLDIVKDSLNTTDTYQKKGAVKNGEQVEHLFSKKA